MNYSFSYLSLRKSFISPFFSSVWSMRTNMCRFSYFGSSAFYGSGGKTIVKSSFLYFLDSCIKRDDLVHLISGLYSSSVQNIPSNSDLIVDHSTFLGCSSLGHGGAIYYSSAVSCLISHSLFDSCSSVNWGGAFFIIGSNMSVVYCCGYDCFGGDGEFFLLKSSDRKYSNYTSGFRSPYYTNKGDSMNFWLGDAYTTNTNCSYNRCKYSAFDYEEMGTGTMIFCHFENNTGLSVIRRNAASVNISYVNIISSHSITQYLADITIIYGSNLVFVNNQVSVPYLSTTYSIFNSYVDRPYSSALNIPESNNHFGILPDLNVIKFYSTAKCATIQALKTGSFEQKSQVRFMLLGLLFY